MILVVQSRVHSDHLVRNKIECAFDETNRIVIHHFTVSSRRDGIGRSPARQVGAPWRKPPPTTATYLDAESPHQLFSHLLSKLEMPSGRLSLLAPAQHPHFLPRPLPKLKMSCPSLISPQSCSRQLDPPSHEHTTSMQLAIRHSVWFWNRWADLSAVIFSWGSWAAARSGSPAGRTTCPCGLLRSCFHWIAYSVLSYLYSTCSRFLS